MQLDLVDMLTSLPGDTHASRLALSANDQAKAILPISGQNCLKKYALSGRDGLFVKTLMNIFTTDLMKLPHKWNLKTTQYGRLYFQLRLLVRPTLGNDYGLSPTPTAQDSNRKRYGFKNKDRCKPSLPLRGLVPHGMYPNPRHWEWKMGYPKDYTELEVAATPSYRKSRTKSARQ